MKLSKEDLKRIDAIKRGTNNLHETWKDLPFLINCIDKLRPRSRERFTYEMLTCGGCKGTGWSRNIGCYKCKGTGQIKTKVKRTAHSV